jgi:hypothetical protein
MSSEAPPPGENVPGAPSRRGRVYLKYAVGVLAAFGILGAVGTRVVDKVFSSAGERLNPESLVLIGVREDPGGAPPGFAVAGRSAEGLDAKLKGAEDCNDLFLTAKRAGAVDVGHVKEALVLEGGTRRDLSIVAMRARILKREPALRGAEISCESAGAAQAIGVIFNLDEERPVARELVDRFSLEPGAPYFEQGNIVRLTKGEIQPFLLIGVTSRDYVEWEVEADVIIDEQTETITINNDGEPFKVTGPARKKAGYGRYYEWQWYERPPKMWIADKPCGREGCRAVPAG